MTVRLFCVPFAGGSSYSYRSWQQHLVGAVDVAPVEYPGRGRRSDEPLITTMDDLVDDVYRQVLPLDETYAIFGHSMGACVAYLLVRRIVADGLPPPLHLFCSGRNGPALPGGHRGRHLLPREGFVEVLREMGGCPEEILGDEDMVDYFLPILRADFCAHASYEYTPDTPLDLPLTAMLGRQDDETTREGVREWQRETRQPIDIVEFAGSHFFIVDHVAEIGHCVSQRLRRSMAPVRTSGSARC